MSTARDELKNINAMVKAMDEQLNTLRDLTDSMIVDIYDLNIGIKDAINKILPSEIESMTEDDFVNFLNTNHNGKGENKNLEHMKKGWKEHKEYADKEFVEFCRYVFMEIKKSLGEISQMEEDRNKLMGDINKISEDYFKYINSPEYREKKLSQIEDMRKQAEIETDPSKKRNILYMLETMENSETLNFIYKRINENPKEVEYIVEKFFNERKSSYIIERFKNKLPRFGYNPEIYKRLFNIEEMFLPEEYKDLNNIFLFNVMSLIAYYSPDDKRDSMYTTSILIKIVNLVYHQFGDDSYEKEFIEFIRKFDEQFLSFAEVFKEKNITSPNHPVRIEKEKEMEAKRRDYVISKLTDKGIEVDTSKTTEELSNQLLTIEKEEIDRMKAEMQKLQEEEKANSDGEIETVDVNGPDEPVEETVITPDAYKDNPFESDDIKTLMENIKTPIDIVDINGSMMNIYDTIYPDNTYLLGFDIGASEVTGDCSFVVLSLEGMNIIADMKDENLNVDEFSDIIVKVVATYFKKASIIGVRKGISKSVINKLIETEVSDNIFHDTVVNEEEWTANEMDGFAQDQYTKVTMSELLTNIVSKKTMKIASKNIVNDIRKLTVTDDNHIAPISGTCSVLNSYLNAVFVWANIDDYEKFGCTKTSESIEENDAIDESDLPFTKEVEVYEDGFKYYYRKDSDGTYTYYTDKNEVCEENISEDIVLRLLSTGSVTKKIITV